MTMRVLVTGANGFVARNLMVHLAEAGFSSVDQFGRQDGLEVLAAKIAAADAIVHLAGENRPQVPADFATNNAGLTRAVCDAIAATGRTIPLYIASSIQAENDNPYGLSKAEAEAAVEALGAQTGNPAWIVRLPNIFGKWCKPNYNSAVVTFCHNIARGLPITIHDPAAPLRLVHVDDVCAHIIAFLSAPRNGVERGNVAPVHETTVGEVADLIRSFAGSRETLLTDRVGTGFIRLLYATYVSYLPPEAFSYTVPVHGDPRGVFVEMLKTPDCGQFSFFTAHPGITRGGHYHHVKTEKFLVIKGEARFGFRHIVTDEVFTLETSGAEPRIVETIPGWSHDITNIGEDEMVVMLWANEIFDRDRPDTIASKV
jgi:UDP-2-acetamido-2,6-beta-L-arabino-hexul-4-ose reductase